MEALNSSYNRFGFLSGATLKILACIFMTFDHAGLVLFPSVELFRIIGRLAFPLFAFFIAEGCRYTKNKVKHFLLIFTIGVAFFIFYYIYDGEMYGNIFLTFSVSILLVYLLKFCKKKMFEGNKLWLSVAYSTVFLLAVTGVFLLSRAFHFEYGFSGIILPVAVSLNDLRGIEAPSHLKKLDNHLVSCILFSLGVLFLCYRANLGGIQTYSLLSIICILFYNGKPGTHKLKYFFYIFYPAHLLILELILTIIRSIK